MQNIATKVDYSSTLSAAEFNSLVSDISNLVTTAGLSLSGGDLYQLAESVATYTSRANYYTDSGTANAYILAPTGSLKTPQAYAAGMSVRFKPANSNTTASTINVNSLGVKSIKDYTGSSDPLAGDLTSGVDVTLIYDGTNFRLPKLSSPLTGTMFNVNQVQKTDSFVTTSSAFVDVTGLSVSITPSSTSNKVLCVAVLNGTNQLGGGGAIRLVRNSTAIALGTTSPGINTPASAVFSSNVYTGAQSSGVIYWLDTPATTSATTYKVQGGMGGNAGTLYINLSNSTTASDYFTTVSTLTAIEIKG